MASLFGADVVLSQPPGLRIGKEIEAQVKANAEANGGSFEISDKMEDACEDADIVYAKNYVALDLLPPVTDKPEPEEMMALFDKYKGWIADEKRMNMAKGDAKYMHCLPCERGAEVTDAVLDGIWGQTTYDEAENRLHAQKGVMAAIIP
jgi:N-acetylornithine carbamoyltransferase